MVLKPHMKFIVAVAILGLCSGILYSGILFPVDEGGDSFGAEFPSRISDWRATDVVYDPDTLSALSPDRIVYKTYHENESLPVTLFLACYGTLEKADLSHSPIVCFTGQGWQISETSVDEISVSAGDTTTIRVNTLIQNKLDTKLITLYWYQSVYRADKNRGMQKIVLFLEKMKGNSNKNAFVRITSVIPAHMTISDTRAELHRFVQVLYPELRRYLQ